MITLKGKIKFDPVDKTAKHKRQASWKRIAIIEFERNLSYNIKGICEYYAWFIKKRYNLTLNMPIRRAHVTFINDNIRDINGGDLKWEEIKRKYDGTEIDVVLSIDPRTDSSDANSTGHWWLTIPKEYRGSLQSIRDELGLGLPFYGFHLSIGYANSKNIEHSKYIHSLIKKHGRNYN